MYASLIIFAGLVVGGLSVGQLGDAVTLFREEIETIQKWGKVGKRTVESVLEGLETSYNNFKAKESHTANEIHFMIGQEYHMYSIINQETSLRKDSEIVTFVKRDLDNLLDKLFKMCNGTPCYDAINTAQTSLKGSFNYRDQSYYLKTVSKNCQ